jgi:capsular exopolysaccharide synthesis family protein
MTTEPGAAPSLRTYGQIIRRRKWWVIWMTLAGLAVSLGLSLNEPDQYSATAQVIVQASTASTALGAVQQSVTATQVQTLLLLVTGAPVQQAVRRKLGSVPAVSASEVAQTDAIAITAISGSPARAALIANTYARAFVSNQVDLAITATTAAESQLKGHIKALRQQITAERAVAGDAAQVAALVSEETVLSQQLAQLQVDAAGNTAPVVFDSPAQVPTSPSSPKPKEDGALGLVAGLILGLGAAFLRDNLDDALLTAESAERTAGSPVLATVPLVPSWKRRDRPLVISITNPTSPAAEAYRSLRTSLQFAGQERELRTILVTSPASEEGKTTTLANLGAVFAQAGKRVVLVSCDLRRPRLGKFLGTDEKAGLTSVLLGEHALPQVIQPVQGDRRLCLLPSGPLPPNPAELLSGQGVREVFAALAENFDIVLIDSPPLLPVTDSVLLSRQVDATLLVVAAGQTRRGELHRAAEKLEQVSAPVIGIVLNEVTRLGNTGYYYQYGSYDARAAQSELSLNGHNGHAPASSGRRPHRHG